MDVAAIVLAAGRGRRMGGDKHLLEVDGRPMLAHVVTALRKSRVRQVVVVLRPGDADGVALLESLDCPGVFAEDPGEGRAASIRAGVRAVPEDCGLLFALADQPRLLAGDFGALIAARASEAIVHASYDGKRGSPVLFAPFYRDALLELRGKEGGRSVLGRYPDRLRAVELDPWRGVDLDCPEDLD